MAGFTLNGDRPNSDVSQTLIYNNTGNGVTIGNLATAATTGGNPANLQTGHICASIGGGDIYMNTTGIQVEQPLRPGLHNRDLQDTEGTDAACRDNYNGLLYDSTDTDETQAGFNTTEQSNADALGDPTCSHPVCHIPSTNLDCIGPHNNLIACPPASDYDTGEESRYKSNAALPECIFFPEYLTAARVISNNVYQNSAWGMHIFPSYTGQPSPNYSDPIDPASSGTVGDNQPTGDNAIQTFILNRFHGNGNNQIEFEGGIPKDSGTVKGGWPFNIDGPDGSCNNGVNSFFCYRNRGSVGVDTFAVHASNNAVLLVNHAGFAGGNTNNEDFEFDNSSLVTVFNKCTATSTCP